LIEPYMEKDFSDKCIVRAIGIDNQLYQYWEVKDFFNWHIKIVYETCTNSFNMENILLVNNAKIIFTDEFWQQKNKIKILWHYDITAVLKYFEEHFYSWWKLWPNIINIEKDYIEIQEIKEMCKCDIPKRFTIVWKFPNKPLHLYTEEEDKNLLDLLVNLK
jgi:hypothetical protein